MLDGLARLEPLVDRARDLGMHSLAITDHGGLYGAIDFYNLARASGIKPIIGCEMYVASGSRFDKNPADKIHHLTVLARDSVGYKNLVKLVSASHLEGYYKKPRIDREILEQHSGGLLVLSGCPSGEVPWLLGQGRYEEAKETAGWYQEVFGSYFLEFMKHGGVPELPDINRGLVSLNKDLKIPLVATNDSHYVLEDHAINHEILLCIQTNTNINDENRMRFGEASYHLRSSEEMLELFSDFPEAVMNTEMVAEMCNVELDFTQARLPEFPVPSDLTSDQFLSNICWEGFKKRGLNDSSYYTDRLKYELEVIQQTSFADYFLVVWDIARFVRENNIYFTVRGSAAASLVLYCLEVTDVDPMSYSLVFERFLNIERKEMPDIDMDFQDDRRQEVINYCASRYGREHVAHIITFGTFGARQSVRDAGRALGMTLPSVDRIARMIPEKLNIDIDTSLKESHELKSTYETNNEDKKLIDTAKQLEGVTRHKSMHAAGVVISKEPLNDVVPLEFTSRGDDNGAVMTQYSMRPLAELGLLKMDFLGLLNLRVLGECINMIKENHGISLTLGDISLDDEAAFSLLSRGETVGIFQLESAGMTRHIKDLKPTTLNDVSAMIALFRPGPMEHISTFIEAKHGRSEVTYVHPALKDILEETYGVIVYQDQVLHIAREFAGYSLGEADIVRKAMGKKDPVIMSEEKDKFINGALEKGHSQQLAENVFNLVEPFAGYAFNKAHSVSYGLVSYWTAYLKANYTPEYMAAFLNAYMDKKDRLISAVADCRRIGIEVLPPDINKSDVGFKIEMGDSNAPSIRFGLAAIKNVGSEGLGNLLRSRENSGNFESIEDICRNGDLGGLNRKSIESLVMCGVFDAFGDRAGILEVIDRVIALANEETRMKTSNQSSLFDMLADSSADSLMSIEIPEMATNDRQKRVWEVDLMGISLSTSNLLAKAIRKVDEGTVVMQSQLVGHRNNGKTTLLGQISTVTDRLTRDKRPFKVLTVEMIDGTIEAVVWEDLLEKTESLWGPGMLLKITGNVRDRDGELTMSVLEATEVKLETIMDTNEPDDKVNNYDAQASPSIHIKTVEPELNNIALKPISTSPAPEQKEKGRRKLLIYIKESDVISEDQLLLDELKRTLLSSRGVDEVSLEIETSGIIVAMDWPPVKVNADLGLETELKKILKDAGDVSVQSLMF
jgi:DNA polymerase-3 subunit alpha